MVHVFHVCKVVDGLVWSSQNEPSKPFEIRYAHHDAAAPELIPSQCPNLEESAAPETGIIRTAPVVIPSSENANAFIALHTTTTGRYVESFEWQPKFSSTATSFRSSGVWKLPDADGPLSSVPFPSANSRTSYVAIGPVLLIAWVVEASGEVALIRLVRQAPSDNEVEDVASPEAEEPPSRTVATFLLPAPSEGPPVALLRVYCQKHDEGTEAMMILAVDKNGKGVALSLSNEFVLGESLELPVEWTASLGAPLSFQEQVQDQGSLTFVTATQQQLILLIVHSVSKEGGKKSIAVFTAPLHPSKQRSNESTQQTDWSAVPLPEDTWAGQGDNVVLVVEGDDSSSPTMAVIALIPPSDDCVRLLQLQSLASRDKNDDDDDERGHWEMSLLAELMTRSDEEDGRLLFAGPLGTRAVALWEHRIVGLDPAAAVPALVVETSSPALQAVAEPPPPSSESIELPPNNNNSTAAAPAGTSRTRRLSGGTPVSPVSGLLDIAAADGEEDPPQRVMLAAGADDVRSTHSASTRYDKVPGDNTDSDSDLPDAAGGGGGVLPTDQEEPQQGAAPPPPLSPIPGEGEGGQDSTMIQMDLLQQGDNDGKEGLEKAGDTTTTNNDDNDTDTKEPAVNRHGGRNDTGNSNQDPIPGVEQQVPSTTTDQQQPESKKKSKRSDPPPQKAAQPMLSSGRHNNSKSTPSPSQRSTSQEKPSAHKRNPDAGAAAGSQSSSSKQEDSLPRAQTASAANPRKSYLPIRRTKKVEPKGAAGATTDPIGGEQEIPPPQAAAPPPKGPPVDICVDCSDLDEHRAAMDTYLLTKLLGYGKDMDPVFVAVPSSGCTLRDLIALVEAKYAQRLVVTFGTPAGKLVELKPSTWKLFSSFEDDAKQLYVRPLYPHVTMSMGAQQSSVSASDAPQQRGGGPSSRAATPAGAETRNSNPGHKQDDESAADGYEGAAAHGSVRAASAPLFPSRLRRLTRQEQETSIIRLHDIAQQHHHQTLVDLSKRLVPVEEQPSILTKTKAEALLDRLYRAAPEQHRKRLETLQREEDQRVRGQTPHKVLSTDESVDVTNRMYASGLQSLKRRDELCEKQQFQRKPAKKVEDWAQWQASMSRVIGKKYRSRDPNIPD